MEKKYLSPIRYADVISNYSKDSEKIATPFAHIELNLALAYLLLYYSGSFLNN
jgi:hypothetical protein